MSRLGRLSKVNELRLEIYRRKLNVSVSGKTKQQLIAILLENDKDVQRGQPDEDDIDREYAAAQNVEDDLESEDDVSPNLDDPEDLSIIMNEVQAWSRPVNKAKKENQKKKLTNKEKKKDKVEKGAQLGGTTMLLAVQFRRSHQSSSRIEENKRE